MAILTSFDRIRVIVQLGTPLMGVMLSQNLLGIIDLAMIGQLGTAAIAGVGVASLLFSMCVAFFNGVDSSVQATVARLVGERRVSDAVRTLNTALALSFAIGALLLVIAELLLPLYLQEVLRDEEAVLLGGNYLKVRLPILFFIGASYAFSAYWNATGRSMRSLYGVVVLLVCNVAFNYVLIFGKLGFEPLGVVGAALGSFLASIVSLLVHVVFALCDKINFVMFREFTSLHEAISMLKKAIPIGIQQMLALLGFSVLMFVIGSIGITEVAIANVLFIIVSLQLLPVVGMGVAATTLVGQAIGRNEVADANTWGWEAAQTGTFLTIVFAVVLVLFPGQVLEIFLTSSEAVASAVLPLRILAVYICLDTFARVLNFALRGAGAMNLAAALPFTIQWVFELPLAWVVGIGFGFGLLGVIGVLMVTSAMELALTIISWRKTSSQRLHT